MHMCMCVFKRAVSTLINCGEITWFSKRGVCHQKPLHRSISHFSTVSRLIWRGAVSLKTDRRVKLMMRDAGLGKKTPTISQRVICKQICPPYPGDALSTVTQNRQAMTCPAKASGWDLNGGLVSGPRLTNDALFSLSHSDELNAIALSDADGRR